MSPRCAGFPFAHKARALFSDHRSGDSQTHHTVDLPLTATVQLVIGMLGHEIVAEEVRPTRTGVRDQRFVDGEFELERVVQERADFVLDLLSFRFWTTKTKPEVIGIA